MTLSWSKAYVTIEKLKKKISTLKAENEMLKKDIAHRSLAIVIGTDFISKQKVMEAWSDYHAKKITMSEFAQKLGIN